MIFQFLLDVSICYVILATQIVELYMNYPTGGSETAQRVLEHQPDFIDRKYQHSAINYLFGIIEWSCGNILMQNEPYNKPQKARVHSKYQCWITRFYHN